MCFLFVFLLLLFCFLAFLPELPEDGSSVVVFICFCFFFVLFVYLFVCSFFCSTGDYQPTYRANWVIRSEQGISNWRLFSLEFQFHTNSHITLQLRTFDNLSLLLSTCHRYITVLIRLSMEQRRIGQERKKCPRSLTLTSSVSFKSTFFADYTLSLLSFFFYFLLDCKKHQDVFKNYKVSAKYSKIQVDMSPNLKSHGNKIPLKKNIFHQSCSLN